MENKGRRMTAVDVVVLFQNEKKCLKLRKKDTLDGHNVSSCVFFLVLYVFFQAREKHVHPLEDKKRVQRKVRKECSSETRFFKFFLLPSSCFSLQWSCTGFKLPSFFSSLNDMTEKGKKTACSLATLVQSLLFPCIKKDRNKIKVSSKKDPFSPEERDCNSRDTERCEKETKCNC